MRQMLVFEMKSSTEKIMKEHPLTYYPRNNRKINVLYQFSVALKAQEQGELSSTHKYFACFHNLLECACAGVFILARLLCPSAATPLYSRKWNSDFVTGFCVAPR